MIHVLQCERNQDQWEMFRGVVDTTTKCEKLFFNPYFLAGCMLRTERGVISVSWEGGMVCENLSCLHNGFFGSRDDHIEVEVQIVLALFGIALKGSCKKHPNRDLNPV